ncbi:MAG: hypothetical protein DRH17_12210 [Deltaproteobacteria bacterium]|nr:MAG: hypothetical protein DRH17_12210 [Deltaproteobacteria bacterium]
MELGKVYFLVEMNDGDYFVLLTLCNSLKKKKNEIIMEALRDYVMKLQEEWRASKKVEVKKDEGKEK